MNSDLALAEALGARICHDLGGPVGIILGALELAEAGDAEALGMAREAAAAIGHRLRAWRATSGGAAACRIVDLAELLQGMLAGGRATLDISALPPDTGLAAGLAQTLLPALLLAGEALPRGGVVRLAGDPARELTILPDGPRAAWPAGLAAALAGKPDAPSARAVLAPFLVRVARHHGVQLSLLLAGGEAIPPLLLAPAA